MIMDGFGRYMAQTVQDHDVHSHNVPAPAAELPL
jgi:hypothetical protein